MISKYQTAAQAAFSVSDSAAAIQTESFPFTEKIQPERDFASRNRTSPDFGISRDEMNLAEFPLTVLSTRVNTRVKTLEFRDTQRRKDGELVHREWIITAADKFGLPTSTDDDVVLGLIRLTMNQGFRDRKVYFSRYELLRVLRWSTEGRSYGRLTKSLDRLSGVRIRATNAFFDNSLKGYQTCNFGLIDAYEINDERSGKSLARRGLDGVERNPGEQRRSFFIWSEVLFDSFKSGFIKKLDMELYFTLKSAVSRRLYRYLDKHFYYRNTIDRQLTTLAFEKLGLSRNYRFISQLKQQIEPAADELVKAGFLSGYEFVGRGEETAIRFISGKTEAQPETLIASRKAAPLPPAPVERKNIVVEALLSRGISLHQANRLLEGRGDEALRKTERVIEFYDQLVERNDDRVSRNRIGFLYRAVESPERFSATFEREVSKEEVRPPVRDRIARKRPELRIFRANGPQ